MLGLGKLFSSEITGANKNQFFLEVLRCGDAHVSTVSKDGWCALL